MRTSLCLAALIAAAPGPARAQDPTAAPEGPAAGPSLELQAWAAKERRIKVHVGLSWAFTGVGLVGVLVPLAGLGTCGRSDALCNPLAAIIVAPFFAGVMLAAGIPAAIHTARLVRHRRERPVARLQLAPGGLALHF